MTANMSLPNWQKAKRTKCGLYLSTHIVITIVSRNGTQALSLQFKIEGGCKMLTKISWKHVYGTKQAILK